MGKKKSKQPQPEEYHVEVITAARVLDTLEWEYHVKWAGYDSESDSWEPQANVESCTELLKRFWKHIGLDDEDYPAGHVCEAKPSWIRKEKKMFANNFPEVLQNQKQRAKAEKAAQVRVTAVGEASPAASSSSKTKGKRKRSKGVSSVIDDESSDGEPLAKKAKSTIDQTMPITRDKGKQKATGSPSSPVYFGGDVVDLFTPPDSPSKESPTRPAEPSSPEIPTASSSSFPIPSEQNWRRKLQTQATAPQTTIVGSSLSTKQRLSQNALSVTVPNTKIAKKTSLAGLSFKKRPDAGIAPLGVATSSTPGSMPLPRRKTTGAEPTITVPDSPVAPREASYSMFLPGVTQPSPPVQSPVDFFQTTLPAEETPHYEDYNPHIEDFISELHFPSPKNQLLDQAEQFLQAAMPLELAAPLPPEPLAKQQTQTKDIVQEPEIPAPVATILRPKLPPKAQTKYSWKGPLWSEDGDKSEHLCDICLTDVSDPLPDGLRLNILLQTVDSFRCKGLYDQMDVVQILLACKKTPQQFARVTPKEPKDTEALTALTRSINRLRQAIVLPLCLDNKIVSLLLVFSAIGSKPLARKLSLPSNYQQSKTPVAVLLAWSLPSYERQEWRHLVNKAIYHSLPYEPPSISRAQYRKIRHLCTMMRVLRFPQDLYEFLNRATRSYCVWWEGGDGASKQQGWETDTLQTVLEACGAEDGGYRKSVRVVFVHVASILTLHRLPDFLERRSKRLDVCFYTYGTHHRVPPSLWGIRPIYPAGGIVTFTPQALLGNPDVLRMRIKQIVAHTFWDCYVLPTTVAMASLLSAGKNDPLDLFDRGKLFTEYYLQMIEEGDIAMMEAPPLEPYFTNPRALEWRAATEAQRNFTRRDYLEYALKEFNASYSNVPESDWLTTAEGAITKDLHMMQTQPCFMSEYRRFVVIRGSQESYEPDVLKDSFEWVSAERFDFNDQLFDKWSRSQLEKFDEWDFPIF
ncbi:hypothetical protein PLEOSDRAFT_1101525 [Pleurotus ostreatus PC15]|uniref:Chromo domain-containing protein n=1 Tax=Pleurotus ostreatus (strain PC15) TaxID=1137138 RepID=A0A067P292_PLEO1|nr:hypothetical protein PLEOSDRAFT_1101525 [Pleurotus ostreatus PC15]